MAPKANSSTPSTTLLSTTPTRKPVANSKPDPKLKPNFSHRGASLFELSHTLHLPTTGSPAIILPLALLRGGGNNLLLSASFAPTNKAPNRVKIELSRAALMRTLHERSIDKRRTA